MKTIKDRVERVMPGVISWLKDGGGMAEADMDEDYLRSIKEDVQNALMSADYDGFRAAVALKHSGWVCDFELARILDGH